MPERALTSAQRYQRQLDAGRCVRCIHSLAADGRSHCEPCLAEMAEARVRGPQQRLVAPSSAAPPIFIPNNREPTAEAKFLAAMSGPGDADGADDAGDADDAGELLDVRRPRTRAECEGTKVCPWVSCKWHLMLDVNPRTGRIKVNYPGIALEDLPATCALEVIDSAPGGISTGQIGVALNITRAGARLLIEAALAEVAALGGQ